MIPVDAAIRSENEVELESVDVSRVLIEMENADNGLNIVVCERQLLEKGLLRQASKTTMFKPLSAFSISISTRETSTDSSSTSFSERIAASTGIM